MLFEQYLESLGQRDVVRQTTLGWPDIDYVHSDLFCVLAHRWAA